MEFADDGVCRHGARRLGTAGVVLSRSQQNAYRDGMVSRSPAAGWVGACVLGVCSGAVVQWRTWADQRPAKIAFGIMPWMPLVPSTTWVT
jgi:hypothetical protein